VSFTEVHNLLLVRSRLGLGLGNDLGLLFCALAVNLSVLFCALAVDLSEASVDLVFENGERADTRLAPILQLLVDHLAFVAFVLDLPLNAVEQTMLDSELLLGVAFRFLDFETEFGDAKILVLVLDRRFRRRHLVGRGLVGFGCHSRRRKRQSLRRGGGRSHGGEEGCSFGRQQKAVGASTRVEPEL